MVCGVLVGPVWSTRMSRAWCLLSTSLEPHQNQGMGRVGEGPHRWSGSQLWQWGPEGDLGRQGGGWRGLPVAGQWGRSMTLPGAAAAGHSLKLALAWRGSGLSGLVGLFPTAVTWPISHLSQGLGSVQTQTKQWMLCVARSPLILRSGYWSSAGHMPGRILATVESAS